MCVHCEILNFETLYKKRGGGGGEEIHLYENILAYKSYNI